MSLILRIRTQLGTWRLKDVNPNDTFAIIRARIEREHTTDLTGRPITSDIEGNHPFPETMTIAGAGLVNGSMIFVLVDETKTGVHEAAQSSAKRIAKDGSIVAQDYSSLSNSQGFRPGMMSLRSIKKQWTLSQFIQLDEQFVFRLTATKPAYCKLASTDSKSMEEFSAFARSLDFRRMRVGYLYGTFNEATFSTNVDFIYEPPQDCTDRTFTILEDPAAERVEQLAGMLGKRKVGWIFAHPPREKGFFFSCHEVLTAAELQLESADGINDSLFVTIKVTLDAEEKPLVDAWQISSQGLEMVAEGALQVSEHMGKSKVAPQFTAIVEGKPAAEIDNNFFLTRVGIGSYDSNIISTFPKANREMYIASRDDLKDQLSKAGKKGWTLKALLLDFHLLLFLCDFMDITSDLPRLCQCLLDPEANVDEGYQLLIRSFAGLN